MNFSATAQVRKAISLQDISEEERRAAWYFQEEYDEITESCFEQIQRMERGEMFRDIKYCARGLEVHCGSQALVKIKNRSLAIQVVIEEQERQLELFTDHSMDAIALVYHHASSSSQLWATTVGLKDQREAEVIRDEDFFAEEE